MQIHAHSDKQYAGQRPEWWIFCCIVLKQSERDFKSHPDLKFKYTFKSMNNTRGIDRNGKFEKDKTSEKKNSILPEEATQFGDSLDKRI